MTRMCRTCERQLPESAFNARAHNTDGSVRWWRSYCRTCEAASNSQRRTARQQLTSPVDIEVVPRLPIGPFADWLAQQVDRFESVRQMADHFGWDEAVLRRWIKRRQPTVSLDTVDRALCQTGAPWLLCELYPLDEARVAA